jgi:histidine triad (HIT) family protein
MNDTIFDRIVRGEQAYRQVWEDAEHLAFLTPFPNTPGLTILIPKRNWGDYVFDLTDRHYLAMMRAARQVAKLLERAFDTPRVAMVFEGTGVAYVHAKLYPLHGSLASGTDVWSGHQEFHPTYAGYITTAEGPAMGDGQLDEIQARILQAHEG